MKTRTRVKQTLSLRDRVELWTTTLRDRAASLPPGKQKEVLLKKVRTAEAARYLEAWVNSPGLRPPE